MDVMDAYLLEEAVSLFYRLLRCQFVAAAEDPAALRWDWRHR